MKKLIFNSVLCLAAMLFGMNANAQSVYTANTTSPAACDGYAIFVDSLNLGNYETFVWMDDSTNILSDSTFVTNLCAGTYTVTCTNANGGDTTITFTIGSEPISACTGFGSYMTVQQATWGQCDGSMTVTPIGGTAPYTYEWEVGVFGNSTINNLCYNTYHGVTVTDANGCLSFSYGFTTDSINNPCLNFNVAVTSSTATANACDGSASAYATGGYPVYSYTWSNGATTPAVYDLCPGTYSVTVTDSLNCSITGWVNIYVPSIDSSLVVSTTSTSVSDDGECDGTITASGWGGSGSYIYVLSNGYSNNTGYFDSLCQGIYTVTVFDTQGDTVYVDVIVSNPGNTYTNGTYSDSMYVDSVLSDLQEDCSINYQTIDSVYIAGYNYFGDSILVYWNVVSSSGTSVIMQSYYIGGPAGVYSLGIQVYCPMKSIGNYFVATDQIYYTGLPLGIEEQTMGEVSVYPNPVADVMNIKFTEVGDYEMALYDLSGRSIMTQQNKDTDFVTLDVSTLAKGQYTLVIVGDKGKMSKSIIK